MIYRFTIKGTLPSLNEYLKAERSIRRGNTGRMSTAGNDMKHQYQTKIAFSIRNTLKRTKISKPVKIHYEIYEPNEKRDFDNVLSVIMKYTQDALVTTGVLKDDSRKYVNHVSANMHTDRKNPRIEVSIIEVD